MILFDEVADVTADGIAHVPDRYRVSETLRFQFRRALHRPGLSPDCAGEYGAGAFSIPIAQRDDVLKSFAQVRIDRFRPRGRNIDSNLAHCDYGIRVETPRL